MIRDIDGDSGNSMTNYYGNSTNGLKNHIDAQDENLILTRDIDELVDFFTQDYLLPKLEVDSTNKPIIEKEQSSRGYSNTITIKVALPLVQEEGIDKSISLRASTRTMSFGFSLEKGCMTTRINLESTSQNPDSLVKNRIEYLEKTIINKNRDIESGNNMLKSEIKKYIESRKQKLQQENSMLESIPTKINVQLKKKQDAPAIDLKIKKQIRIVMPEPKKEVDAQLEKETLETIIDLIQNQGRQFEITPRGYVDMDEELLRDNILGMLNAVFPGDATGESFVHEGKTDIRLKHSNIEGGILSGECKFWGGEKLYQDTIDQHFKYLTWRQDYAIQITFSKNEGFTDVLEKAKKASQEHKTYVDNSFREIDKQHFVTEHIFPDDPKKKVEVHHLLFDLYVRKK